MTQEATSARSARASVTHATPLRRDARYDHRAQQGALAIQLHHSDGLSTESVLILTPGQVEQYAIQFEQLIDKRQRAREAD